MKNYKLLRFGHCYINHEGDFVIGLVGGDKRHGYVFLASHAHPSVMLGKIQIQSRIVPNDGHWLEIDPEAYNIASILHASGLKMKVPVFGGDFRELTKI